MLNVLTVGYLYIAICKDVLNIWDMYKAFEIWWKQWEMPFCCGKLQVGFGICPCCFENVISVSRNEPNQSRKTVIIKTVCLYNIFNYTYIDIIYSITSSGWTGVGTDAL